MSRETSLLTTDWEEEDDEEVDWLVLIDELSIFPLPLERVLLRAFAYK
jgi:hypothetical protein